jgi:hypothetical protein
MFDDTWVKIAKRLDEHGYMQGIERTVSRVQATGEIFTPAALVVEMVRGLSPDVFAPRKTVLDPACGDGQFLVAAKWIKVYFHGMEESAAVEDIYGVDIMSDNVEICRHRLGGGTILVGDSLNPARSVAGQTDADRFGMQRLFGASTRTEEQKPAQASLFGDEVAALDLANLEPPQGKALPAGRNRAVRGKSLAIVEVLVEQPQPMRIAQIVQALHEAGRTEETYSGVSVYLGNLVKDGSVTRVDRGLYTVQ